MAELTSHPPTLWEQETANHPLQPHTPARAESFLLRGPQILFFRV